jgi:hypothetical protein
MPLESQPRTVQLACDALPDGDHEGRRQDADLAELDFLAE